MIDKFGRTEMGRYFYDPSSSTGVTGDLYVRTDGNSTITSDMDFNSHKIINLGEPIGIHDAATKNYVDTHSTGGSGIGTITADLNLNSHKIINLTDPTSSYDATTKTYVDSKIVYNNIFYTDINMTSHKFTNLAVPTLPSDSATKNYVDTSTSQCVKKDGTSEITADLNLNTHKLTNVVDPTSAQDAATKNYVDTHSTGGSGIGTITADLNLNSHKLINVVNPASAQDAATKNYVDTTLNAGLSLAQKSSVIGIDVNSGLTSLGLKSQILPVNTADATSIFTYSEGPGILRRLWIAVNGTITNGKAVPGNVFLRINVDGVISVGNYALDTEGIGYDRIPLALDLLFSPLGGPYYTNALQGCNVHNDSSLGGYFSLDVPFRTSLDIRLYNNTSSPVTYWVQPFITTFNSIPPSLSSVKLQSVTFRYFNTVYGNEYVLMNHLDTGNGVHLKYVRMHIIGASGNWWESRVRIYDGVNSPTSNDGYVISPWTPYNGNNYRYFPGYDGTSKCIFSSSGLEDFYLSSWNGSNISAFNNESSGLLYQNAASIGSTTTISFYRNFGHSETMPSVSTGRRLVLTLNSGDAQVGQSGSYLAVIGQAYFYA